MHDRKSKCIIIVRTNRPIVSRLYLKPLRKTLHITGAQLYGKSYGLGASRLGSAPDTHAPATNATQWPVACRLTGSRRLPHTPGALLQSRIRFCNLHRPHIYRPHIYHPRGEQRTREGRHLTNAAGIDRTVSSCLGGARHYQRMAQHALGAHASAAWRGSF